MRTVRHLATIAALFLALAASRPAAACEEAVEAYLRVRAGDPPLLAAPLERPAGWEGRIAATKWVAFSKGNLTVHGVDASANLDLDDAFRDLDISGQGAVEIRRGPWMLLLDLTYLVPDGDMAADGTVVNVRLENLSAEVACGYRLLSVDEVEPPAAEERQRLTADFLFGARYSDVTVGILPAGGVRTEDARDWIDPFLGLRLGWDLSRRWSVGLRVDIGGFGAGADLAWNLIFGVEWRITPQLSVPFGWRWYDVEYDEGLGATRFRYDVMLQGPYIGLALRF